MRHRGAVVDVEQRGVCDRDGEWYPFDRLEVAGTTLYYARPLNFRVLKYHERWLIADEGWSGQRARLDDATSSETGSLMAR